MLLSIRKKTLTQWNYGSTHLDPITGLWHMFTIHNWTQCKLIFTNSHAWKSEVPDINLLSPVFHKIQLLPQNWAFLDREHTGCTTTQYTNLRAGFLCLFKGWRQNCVNECTQWEIHSCWVLLTLQAEISLLTERTQQVSAQVRNYTSSRSTDHPFN